MALTNNITDIINIIRPLIKDNSVKKTPGDVFEYEGDNKFTLSQSYVDSTSIKVWVNGTELLPVDFGFDVDTNQVIITASLNNKDIVLSTYDYYKKYSDAELQSAVNSSFAYFAEHRYKKIFTIDDSNNIVAINDFDPTDRELYFICTIASIIIDPKNFDIRTPDFSISAQREKDDRAQISEAFTRYKRFVGSIDYLDQNRSNQNKLY